MSRDQWEIIHLTLTFALPEQTSDLWVCCWLIDSFNKGMEECFHQEWQIVVDESMFKWRGLGNYDMSCLPHMSKVIRKHKGVWPSRTSRN